MFPLFGCFLDRSELLKSFNLTDKHYATNTTLYLKKIKIIVETKRQFETKLNSKPRCVRVLQSKAVGQDRKFTVFESLGFTST